MKLCTKDVAMFLHFHAFLRAESGMGSLLTAALTSVKKPKEQPVVTITEPNSMAGVKKKNVYPPEVNEDVTTAAVRYQTCPVPIQPMSGLERQPRGFSRG